MKVARILVVLICLTTIAAAQQSGTAIPKAAQQHVIIAPNQVKWGPGPPGLPPGAQAAVMDGDPAKAGEPFTLRVKLPDGYKVAPHWHPTDEHLIVLQGTLMLGVGEKFDQTAGHALTVGTYGKMPKEVRHFAWTKGETIFQASAIGPFTITYVNPADDPRQKSPSAMK